MEPCEPRTAQAIANRHDTPEDKVFGTVELLQNILEQRVCQQALVVRRVRRLWRDAFDRSIYLRKALCLKPGNPTADLQLHPFFDTTRPDTALVREHELDDVSKSSQVDQEAFIDSRAATVCLRMVHKSSVDNITINPILASIFPMTYSDLRGNTHAHSPTHGRDLMDVMPQKWKAMFPTHPPKSEVVVSLTVDMSNTSGITKQRTEAISYATSRNANWSVAGGDTGHSDPTRIRVVKHIRVGLCPEALKTFNYRPRDWDGRRAYRKAHPLMVSDLVRACHAIFGFFLHSDPAITGFWYGAVEPPTMQVKIVDAS